jgi:hypothetical protein
MIILKIVTLFSPLWSSCRSARLAGLGVRRV